MGKLFSGMRIGQLELAHRLVTTVHAKPRVDVADYQQRTTPGGLIITELRFAGAGDDDRWKRVTEGIHKLGGVAVAKLPFGSKDQPDRVDVDAVMDELNGAARFARTAGFDGVELDASDGSLPDRFLNAQANTRSDDYGGNPERRMRLLLEASHVAAEQWTSERVGVRLSPCSREGQAGLFAEVMQALSERELAYVHLAKVDGRTAHLPDGRPVSIAACAERRAFRADVSCALIASDHVEVDVAAAAVESRWADAIGFFQTNDQPDFIAQLIHEERHGNKPVVGSRKEELSNVGAPSFGLRRR
jgi:N-ethylmaleimide reductase